MLGDGGEDAQHLTADDDALLGIAVDLLHIVVGLRLRLGEVIHLNVVHNPRRALLQPAADVFQVILIIVAVLPQLGVVEERRIGVVEVILDVVNQLLIAVLHEVVPHTVVGLLRQIAIVEQAAEETCSVAEIAVLAEERGSAATQVIAAVVLVAVRPVEVPHRAENPLRCDVAYVLVVEVGALGMTQFKVEYEVVDHHEAGEGIHVHLVFIPGLLVDRDAEGVEVALDGFQTFRRIGFEGFLREVWVFDVCRQVVDVGVELVCLVVILVELEQYAAVLLIDVYAIVGDTHFFGEVVASAILAIQVEVNGNDVVGTLRSRQAGGFHADGIGHHGVRLVVRQQHPALALFQAKWANLFVELQAVGFLRPAPAAVAASLYPYAILHILIDAVAVEVELRVAISAAAGDVPSVIHVNLYAGYVRRPLCHEVNADGVIPSVVSHHAYAVLRHPRQAAAGQRCGIDDVLSKSVTAYLRLLHLVADIHHSILWVRLKRGGEVFGDGGNVKGDALVHRVVGSEQGFHVPRHLIIVLIVELERCQSR